MKPKLLHLLPAAILAMAATVALADPIVIGSQVPGSDPNSEPCTPTQRTDEYGTQHFNDDVSQSQGKSFDAVLFGDSITDFWVYSNLSFDGDATKTINMGIGSDRVQHLLWRVRNGALDGYTAEYFTLLIGVNNGYQKHVDNHSDPCDRAEDVAESIRLILTEIATKHPTAKILLMPILPYGYDSRYYPALDVRNVNEDINDYIIKFVDYKRVFWVDLRSQYLNPDATCKKSVFGGPGGNYDAVGHYLHPHTDSYPVIWKPALTNAMQRYRAVAAGQPHVAEPSVGYASAAQYGYDRSATITVRGILTGTDANADPVDSYSISYKLDDGPWTVALQNQSRSVTRASFAIPNVALGDHTCQVKVTTADNKVLSTSLDFTMYDGWTGAPLPSDGSAVRTDGTLAYAYAVGNYTVNGVSFAQANGSVDDGNITWPFPSTSGSQAPSSVASGAYRDLLNHCWWANAGEKAVTLKSLTPGHDYLVQIFGYRDYTGHDKSHVWIKESYRDENYMKILGDGWTCGGALTGVFTATEATKAITVCGDNNWAVNGIQVRDLGESGAPVVVQPKIGSVSASTNGTTATIALSGVVMGTNDEGTNATSYAVSYSLNGAAAVVALQGQTAATASFALANLADGEYTCSVTISNNLGKTSAAKPVSFRIGTPPPEVVAPSIGSASATVSGTNATIALAGIVLGTDDEGVAASSYSVSYSLTNAPAATALQNQTGATASFLITNLADGSYTCEVTITTDKGKTAAKSVSFRIGEPPPVPAGWTVGPMASDGSSIRTDGDLVYAYSVLGGTVGGVTFTRATPLSEASMVSASPAAAGSKYGDFGIPSGASGDFGQMLSNGWYWEGAGDSLSFTLTLTGLTVGRTYLVQLVSHRTSNSTTVSANGSTPVYIHGTHDGVDYTYGGSIVGIFEATGTTANITVTYPTGSGNRPLNAIQVRDLGEGQGGGGATVVAPSIGSIAATTNGTTATIALSGIVMGTDDEGTNATSYAVSYSLTNAPAVTVLSNQTGATASFDIENLADGEYTCEVTITTDKNKTASKSVSFTIGTSSQGGGGGDPVVPVADGWTAVAMGATSASIRTDGTLLYAYALGNYTVNGVAFTGVGTSIINNSDCVVWEATGGAQSFGSSAPGDTETGDYKNLLQNGWWANAKDRKIKLNNLEAGKQYLVQIIAFRQNYTTQSATAPDGEQTIKFDGTGWEYGGSLIGIFTASAASQEFTIQYSGQCCINAIQVRELPEGGDPVVPETPVYTLTIPAKTGLELVSVTTNGVAVAAASGNAYAIVSNDTATITFVAASGYEIVSGNPVVVTVTADKTLAANEYPIVREQGGSGGGDPVVPVETGWTVTPMTASGDSIRTNGTLVYAVSVLAETVNGVGFVRAASTSELSGNGSFSFAPPMSGTHFGDAQTEGRDASYGQLLGHVWWWTNTVSDVALTLHNLTPGHQYLVQLVAHDHRASGLTISAEGTEPKPVCGADEENYKYGASLVGIFVAAADTKAILVSYAGSESAERALNAVQVRDLGEVAPPVVKPSIGSVSASASGSTATIVLGDVVMGTDDLGTNATAYAVSFRADGLNEGRETEVLWNQRGSSAWFNVTNVPDGTYVCDVTIATDVGGVASNTVAFTVDSANPATTAWIVTPMSASGDTIRTDGDLLYAHAPNLATVNGVRFERTPYLSNARFSVSPAEADPVWGAMMNEGVGGANGYGYLLSHAWYWDKPATDVTVTVTLEGLTPGRNYLVQLVSHNYWKPDMRVSVGGTPDASSPRRGAPAQSSGTDPKPVGTRTDATIQGVDIPYRYGASIVGIFTASETTQSFDVTWSGSNGEHPINALQVRDLGVAVPVVVEPSIGSASAAASGTMAVVELSGVVKGTDDACNPASTYSVSYVLDGGAPVTALEGRTGTTASFALKDLSSGPHTNVVTITTDAGKSASATVSFEIDATQPTPWITEPMDGNGDNIRTDGDRRWAFSCGPDGGQLEANGVMFTTYEDIDANRLEAKDIRLPFSVSPAMDSAAHGWGSEGVTDPGLSNILSSAFCAGAAGEYTFTLDGERSDFKAGRAYQVQLIMHRSGSTLQAQSPFNVADFVQFGGTDASTGIDWTYGGSLIGTFVITNEHDSYTFKVTFGNGDFAALNAIQVRDLGPAIPVVVRPSIGSVVADVAGPAATVTLAGVVMGTDDHCDPATSYTVSYALGGVTGELVNQNGETASFGFDGLAPGAYVCTVSIATYVGGTATGKTAAGEVSFTVGAPPPAPIIAGDEEKGIEAFVLFDDEVRINITNAVKGLRYGYAKATRLEDLADAEVVWTDKDKWEYVAPANGDFRIDVPRVDAEDSCFYRIAVEWK